MSEATLRTELQRITLAIGNAQCLTDAATRERVIAGYCLEAARVGARYVAAIERQHASAEVDRLSLAVFC